jgi:hypothetical protein
MEVMYLWINDMSDVSSGSEGVKRELCSGGNWNPHGGQDHDARDVLG